MNRQAAIFFFSSSKRLSIAASTRPKVYNFRSRCKRCMIRIIPLEAEDTYYCCYTLTGRLLQDWF